MGPGRRQCLGWNDEENFHVTYWQEKRRLRRGSQEGSKKARGYVIREAKGDGGFPEAEPVSPAQQIFVREDCARCGVSAVKCCQENRFPSGS